MTSRLSYPHIEMLIFAWFAALLVTPWMIRMARAIGAIDRPHTYKTHSRPTPLLGGLAVFIAFCVTVFSTVRFSPAHAYPDLLTYLREGPNSQLFGIVLGATCVVILGVIDDMRPLSAVVKLLVLFLVVLVLRSFGISVDLFAWEPLNVAVSLLWMAGVTSAMNSLDNMDGLAAGTAAIAAAATFVIAWFSWQAQFSYMAVAVLGACLGFLRFNFSPAQVFLGDTGSFLLGFLLAAMTMLGGWSNVRGTAPGLDPLKSAVLPILILGVPIYDITLSTVLRYKNRAVGSIREAIVYCGRDHISHRLVALGLTRVQAVLVIYLMGAIFGYLAATVQRMEREQYVPVLIGAAIVIFFISWRLDRAPVYDRSDGEVPPDAS